MNKKEVLDVIEAISNLYPGKLKMEDAKGLVIAWHRVLKDFEFNNVMANLDAYAANNKFIPTVADLVKPPKIEIDRYVPTAEETKKYLAEQEQVRREVESNPETAKAREKALEDMRKILGIERG